MGIIRGVVITNPSLDGAAKNWIFNENEIDSMAKAYINKPVYDTHEDTKRLGKILAFHRGQNRQVICDLYIDEYSGLGQDVMRRIFNGEIKSLSTGYLVQPNSWGEAEALFPTEISLVPEGEVDGSWIIGGMAYGGMFVSKSGFESVYQPDQAPQSGAPQDQTASQFLPAASRVVDSALPLTQIEPELTIVSNSLTTMSAAPVAAPPAAPVVAAVAAPVVAAPAAAPVAAIPAASAAAVPAQQVGAIPTEWIAWMQTQIANGNTREQMEYKLKQYEDFAAKEEQALFNDIQNVAGTVRKMTESNEIDVSEIEGAQDAFKTFMSEPNKRFLPVVKVLNAVNRGYIKQQDRMGALANERQKLEEENAALKKQLADMVNGGLRDVEERKRPRFEEINRVAAEFNLVPVQNSKSSVAANAPAAAVAATTTTTAAAPAAVAATQAAPRDVGSLFSFASVRKPDGREPVFALNN